MSLRQDFEDLAIDLFEAERLALELDGLVVRNPAVHPPGPAAEPAEPADLDEPTVAAADPALTDHPAAPTLLEELYAMFLVEDPPAGEGPRTGRRARRDARAALHDTEDLHRGL
ncbi:hypothetical protein BH20ACT2_BH20ACT2_24850 [soil metagenome]